MSIRIPGQDDQDDVPVSRADLLDYFHRAGKPREAWRVGVEFERFAVHADGRPATYDDIEGWLAGLHERHGWEAIRNEDRRITAVHRAGQSVSLEPGGQLELATSPVTRLDEAAAELDAHLREFRDVAPGVVLLAAGAHPLCRAADLPLMPRLRHEVMAKYLPDRSPTALDMMKATASVQVALDYADEGDAMRKASVALRLSSVVNALWGNAPVYGGKDAGVVSHRGHVWRHMDADRAGLLTGLLAAGPSFERWVDWLLDVPMMFTCIDGRYRPANGRTFRDWMREPIEGRSPTRTDWEIHLTTVFPEVRLKGFIEVRGADANARPMALAVPAVWKGLLYGAMDEAAALAEEFAVADLPELWEDAHRDGLAAAYRGRPLLRWAGEAVKLAAKGLRATGESGFLDPVRAVLECGRSPGMAFREASPPLTTATLIDRFRFDRP